MIPTRPKYATVSLSSSRSGGRTSLFNDDLPDIILTWFIQITGLTAALVFGVFACLSWVDSQRAKDQANAANLLSIAAISAQVGRSDDAVPNEALQAICDPFFSSAWPNLSAAVEKLLPYAPIRTNAVTTSTSTSLTTFSTAYATSYHPPSASSTTDGSSVNVPGSPDHSGTPRTSNDATTVTTRSSGIFLSSAAMSSIGAGESSTGAALPTTSSTPRATSYASTMPNGSGHDFPHPSIAPTGGARPPSHSTGLSSTGQQIGLGVGVGVASICVVVSTLTLWKLRRRAARRALGEFEPLQMAN